ncbi:dynein light intermediate chain, axonemal [Angomonas deanei]|uniref:Axonemal dynein light chain, putative n=1 Tax=Angomonas deanei TaxID=59799 RepID=A0A7G2CFS6_9TRYP|nr:dynein light intermediate chain, axonemal [Angomonas deanei]CAD2217734.1 Axonemal dynein light chain, putative [Angomonas deanei]|eukprot:EPY26808.1 dynein light intermediate chain, axonemal [Angomonas deanei]
MRRANDPKKILYSIFPPQEVSEENVEEDSVSPDERKSTVVRVSAQPASREDVTALHRAMIQRLELRRAKPTGLCAIRREVYEDVFSEVIRQVTLEEPARGVLLQRLRDELHQSLLLHSNLRNRADYFASRKQNADRSSEEDLKKRIAALEAEKREIEARKAALRKQQAEMNKRYEQERFKRNKDEQEELQYLRRTNQQLSIRLKMETERVSGATGGGGATAE